MPIHNPKSQMKQSLPSLLEEIEQSVEFEIEEVKYLISDLIYQVMQDQSISRAQLAESMHRSRPFITKLLSGSNNFEVSTLVHIARALKCKLNVKNLFVSADTSHASGVNPWIIPLQPRVDRPELYLAFPRPENTRQSSIMLEGEEDKDILTSQAQAA